MRECAMYYRKPNVLIPLIYAAGMAVSFATWADDVTNDNADAYFKGQMATCLSRAKVVFPCVSLSPPGYQANSAFVTSLPLQTNLPLGTDKHPDSWIDKLIDGAIWSPTALFADNLHGMDMNFSVEGSGTGMKMNLGPMKLNMYVDEDHFSESQFILGVDHTW